jgi:hypothetical protein
VSAITTISIPSSGANEYAPFWDRDATSTEATFDVQHVASSVLYLASLPLDANVLSLTVMATKMPFVGRG